MGRFVGLVVGKTIVRNVVIYAGDGMEYWEFGRERNSWEEE